MVHKFFDKKAAAGDAADKSSIKSKNILNQLLVEELHEPIIRKC